MEKYTFETMRIDPPTTEGKRPGTTLLPSWHHMPTPQKPRSPAQLESGTASVTGKKENRDIPTKRFTGLPDTPHPVIKTCHRRPEDFLYDQDAVKKDRPTPSFTPDTYILIRNADRASWIQLCSATIGAMVVQSLPWEISTIYGGPG